jgi:heat shock protein HslJ
MARMLRSTTIAGAILVATATAFALAGCATSDGGTAGAGYGEGGGAGASASAIGTWGDTATRTEPSLVLAQDGTLTGTDGCNRLHGEWTEDGDTVTFDQVAATKMACEGVDTWLSGLASATIAGTEMTVLDASGTEIGTLTRAE